MARTPEQLAKHQEAQRLYRERHPDRVAFSNKRHYENNKQKRLEYQLAWKKRNPDKVRTYRLKREYGLAHGEYERMVESQNGLCLVCSEPLPDVPVVDHDHDTGQVRGLLHQMCNLVVGWAESPLMPQAEAYLRRHKKEQVA